MLLHGVEEPNIDRQDSLSDDNDIREEYSLILANPPFTGNVFQEDISKDILALCKTKKTELLFLALFIKSLKIGGRCACIVPDGVLFGSSKAHKSIRKEFADAFLHGAFDGGIDSIDRIGVGLGDDDGAAVLGIAAVDGLRFPDVGIGKTDEAGDDPGIALLCHSD